MAQKSVNDLRKAAEEAVEDWFRPDGTTAYFFHFRMEALRQALSQPEQETAPYFMPWYFKPPPKREWVGLTDDDFNVKKVGDFDVIKFAKHIEQILKEKNGYE